MARPPMFSVQKKQRIVRSVLRGECTVAEAARRNKCSEMTIAECRDQFVHAGAAALEAGASTVCNRGVAFTCKVSSPGRGSRAFNTRILSAREDAKPVSAQTVIGKSRANASLTDFRTNAGSNLPTDLGQSRRSAHIGAVDVEVNTLPWRKPVRPLEVPEPLAIVHSPVRPVPHQGGPPPVVKVSIRRRPPGTIAGYVLERTALGI